MKYRFIDNITSDVLFEAYGETLQHIFVNSAEALFSVICKTDQVGFEEYRTIEVTAENVSELMIKWLQELIAEVDIEEMFFSKFEISEISETHLKATIYGEPISPEKGETVVKAVTYHQYMFEHQDNDGYMCRVSLDI